MALVDVELDECPGCGQPRSESTLAANEFVYEAVPNRCHSCATIKRAQRRWVGEGTDRGAADGLSFRVRKKG